MSSGGTGNEGLRPEQVQASLPPPFGTHVSALLTLAREGVVSVTLKGQSGLKDVTISNIACQMLRSPPKKGIRGLPDRVAQAFSSTKIVVYIEGKPLILLLDKQSLKEACQQKEQKRLAEEIKGKGMQRAVEEVEGGVGGVWTQRDEVAEVKRRFSAPEVACQIFLGETASAAEQRHETTTKTHAVGMRMIGGRMAYVGTGQEGAPPSLEGKVVVEGPLVGKGGYNAVFLTTVHEPEHAPTTGIVRVPTDRIQNFGDLSPLLEGANKQLDACLTLLRKTEPVATEMGALSKAPEDPSVARLLECSEEGLKLAHTAVTLTSEALQLPTDAQWVMTMYEGVRSCLEQSLQKCAEVTGELMEWMRILTSSKSPDDAERLHPSAMNVCTAVENIAAEIALLQTAAHNTQQAMKALRKPDSSQSQSYQEEIRKFAQLKTHLELLYNFLALIVRSTQDVTKSVKESAGKAVRAAVYRRLEGIEGLVIPQPFPLLHGGQVKTVEVAPFYNQGSLRNAVRTWVLDSKEPEIARQCVFQVAAMHKRGVVHADIKPDNFVVHEETGTKKVRVTLIDWDMATLCDQGDLLNKRKKGDPEDARIYAATGTPRYLPPEALEKVAKGWMVKRWITEEGAKQKDAWALGLTLCELMLYAPPVYKSFVYDPSDVNDQKSYTEAVRELERERTSSSTSEERLLALVKRVALALIHPNPIKRLTTQEADEILSGRAQDHQSVIDSALRRETPEDLQRALAPPPAQKPRREERQE